MDDADRAVALIREITTSCPRRVAGSPSEHRAQQILAERFTRAGAEISWSPFSWSANLYAVLALHFGIAVFGSAVAMVQPLLALPLHLLAGISYLGDGTRRFLLLRRLVPWVESQNLVATLPATEAVRLRIVLVAHADAAFTGDVFHPAVVRAGTKPPPLAALWFLRHGLAVATGACLLLAGADVAMIWSGSHPVAIAVLAALTVPPAIAFLLNAEVVLRNTVVDGANDNLSGCAGAVGLCERLARTLPSDVEVHFVCTGAEEAGTGGANHLAATDFDGRWDPANTVIIGIDGLSNGDLRVLVDAELLPMTPPPWLLDEVAAAVAEVPDAGTVAPYVIPSGATDVLPFLVRSYPALCLGTIDPELGTPRHYHLPEDTVDNLDGAQLRVSMAVVEHLVRRLIGFEERVRG